MVILVIVLEAMAISKNKSELMSEAMSLSQILLYICQQTDEGEHDQNLEAFSKIIADLLGHDPTAPETYLKDALASCTSCQRSCSIARLLQQTGKKRGADEETENL